MVCIKPQKQGAGSYTRPWQSLVSDGQPDMGAGVDQQLRGFVEALEGAKDLPLGRWHHRIILPSFSWKKMPTGLFACS